MKIIVKKSTIIIGVMILLGLFLFGPLVGGTFSNEVGDYGIVKQAEYIITSGKRTEITCNGEDFYAYIEGCDSDQWCKDNWPAGPSFGIRDRSICCNGYCGEYKADYLEVIHGT